MSRSKRGYSTNNPHPIDTQIGQRLRRLRRVSDITQTELGDQIDLSFQQIQKYELAKNRVAASTLFDLAAVLGVSIEYFTGDPTGRKNTGKKHELDLTSEQVQLLKFFKRIEDKNLRTQLIKLAGAMASAITPSAKRASTPSSPRPSQTHFVK